MKVKRREKKIKFVDVGCQIREVIEFSEGRGEQDVP